MGHAGFALFVATLFLGCREEAIPRRDTDAEPSRAAEAQLTATASDQARTNADPAADGSAPVVFVVRKAKVGQVSSLAQTSTSRMELDVKGKTLVIEAVHTVVRETEVLAVTKNADVSRVKVTYTKDEKIETVAGAVKPVKHGPCEGKSYLVEERGGDAVATLQGGGTISPEEAEEVTRHFMHLGEADETQVALAARPRKVGESVDDVARIVEQMISREGRRKGKAGEVKVPKMRLKALERAGGHDYAVFEVTIWMKLPEGGGGIEMEQTGTMKARMDEAFAGEIDADMVGTMKLSGEVKGVGTMTTIDRVKTP